MNRDSTQLPKELKAAPRFNICNNAFAGEAVSWLATAFIAAKIAGNALIGSKGPRFTLD